MSRIHFIAIGGSAMHNLALALHDTGHQISGSDDEIYEPSKSRLEKEGLLPSKFGWFPEQITNEIDAIVLGMHAKPDNPELAKAIQLGIKIYSYPEYIAHFSKNKKRIVIAGSHGKTTTTSIILHALSRAKLAYDYLVGAQIEGFDRMVKLSDAPIIVLEGDEYLSSPIDRRPKMMHYDPDIAVITGVAWDHINVFPTFDNYKDQFRQFVVQMNEGGILIHYKHDGSINQILSEGNHKARTVAYDEIERNDNGEVVWNGKSFPIAVIGVHNLQNIQAAFLVCQEIGVDADVFFNSLVSFKGASRRLQILTQGVDGNGYAYLDFAHAPSKVRATVSAMKDWYGLSKLYTVLELHTFSSLNKDFLPEYANSLNDSDVAYVFYDEHTLKMKGMPELDSEFIQSCFQTKGLNVLTSREELHNVLDVLLKLDEGNVLLMSSGTFGNYNFE